MEKNVVFPVVLFLLILVGTCSGNGTAGVPVHGFCREIVYIGKEWENQRDFLRDETVYSWVERGENETLVNFSWIYTSPRGTRYQPEPSVQSRNDAIFTQLNLSEFRTEDVAGNWSVSIYRNGQDIVTDSFHVSLLTGFNMTLPLLFYGGLVLAFIIVFIHFERKRS